MIFHVPPIETSIGSKVIWPRTLYGLERALINPFVDFCTTVVKRKSAGAPVSAGRKMHPCVHVEVPTKHELTRIEIVLVHIDENEELGIRHFHKVASLEKKGRIRADVRVRCHH